MTDDVPLELDHSLHGRWRSGRSDMTPKPDATALAAYAEGRAGQDIDVVEAALARDPRLLETVLAARAGVAAEPVAGRVLLRAQALVRPDDAPSVVPFRRREAAARIGRLGGPLAWAAVAASLVMVSMVGFGLGVETEQAINSTVPGPSIDLLGDATGGTSG